MVLVKLVGDEDRIKFMRKMAEELMINNPTKKYCDIVLHGTTFDFFIRPMNMFSDLPDAPDGYYINTKYTLSDSITVEHTENAKERKIESGLSFYATNKLNYGKCDSWKNIEEYYPEIRASHRDFCVIINMYTRAENNTDEQWENVNDGEYIGKAESMKDVDKIMCYHIYEFVDETVKDRIDSMGIEKFNEIMRGRKNE